MFFLKPKYKRVTILLACLAYLHAAAQNINSITKPGPLGTKVNTNTGNLHIPRTDFNLFSRGMSLDMTFYYNSYFFDTTFGFGRGWTSEYSIMYRNDTANGKTILWGDGREDEYTINGSNYISREGIFDVLSQYQPGKFLLKSKEGMKYYFDNSTYRKITKMEDPNGNYFSFSYTDSLLTTITNKAGQAITLSYNSSGLLSSVTDAWSTPSRTYTYSYDPGGNLLQVTDPAGGINKYTYLVNGPMKSLSDKNGNVADIIYYGDYSVSEIIGCNKRQSYSYDTILHRTVATDYLADGSTQVTKYQYTRSDEFAWLSSLSGNCCGLDMTFEYDIHGNKVKQTDGNGHITRFTYDNRGNVLTITDALNRVTTYTYTADFNRVASYTDPKGNTITLSYDTRGNLISITYPGAAAASASYSPEGDILSNTDALGHTVNYTYDAQGHLSGMTGPEGYHASAVYNGSGELISFSDADNNAASAEYDLLHRLKKITDPLNNIFQISYDAEGNLVSRKAPNNDTDILKYDASNRPVLFTDALNHSIAMSYDAVDNVSAVKDGLNNTTSFTYDEKNRLKTYRNAAGDLWTMNYDGAGNVIGVTDANGNQLTFTYDNINRLTAVSDNTGSLAAMTYDANSNLKSFTNGAGNTMTAEYDNRNRMTKITDQLNHTQQMTYNSLGQITSLTDREGHTQSMTYDNLNRIKTFTDKNGNTTTLAYDPAGNILSLTDAGNHVTNFTYDAKHRLIRTTYSDGKYTELSYDSKGNIIAKRLTNGTSVTYTYDAANRVTGKILPGGEAYSYTYDAANRVLTATNNAGTVQFAYDGLNRIIAETFDGHTVNYSYSITGRLQTTTYPDGTLIVKSFDTRNRLVSISKNGNPLVSYTYDNANRLLTKTFANGLTTYIQYNAAGMPLNYVTGNNIQNTTVTYDNEKNKTLVERIHAPSRTEAFTYDNQHRLLTYKKGPVGSPLVQSSYTYDAVGNRTTVTTNSSTTSYTSDFLNRITSQTGSTNISFTYDDNRNLTYDGKYYKSYDAENRLLSDSASPSNVIKYVYDAAGRRVKKILNGNILKYTYDGISPIEERDGAGNLLNKTIFAGILTPVSNEKNGIPYYYHQGEQNSVEALSTAGGRLIESYDYDAYGKQVIYDSLGNVMTGSLTGNRFGFTGQLYDSASGMNKFFFREYNPATGIFNEQDLIGYADGPGMYQYVHNNPANGIDIYGLDDCDDPPPPGNNGMPWTMNDWDNTNTLWNNILAVAKEAYTYKADKILDEMADMQQLYMKLGLNKFALDAALETSAKADLLNSGKGALGKVGNGMNAADMAFKAKKLYDVTHNPNSTDNDIRKAKAAMALSTMSAADKTGVMTIYNLLDFAVEKATGKNLVDNADYAGTFYGNLWAHYWWGVPMDWSDPYAPKPPSENGWRPRITDCPQNGDPNGPRKRKYWYYKPDGDSVEITQSHDPNAIIGPDGEPHKKWVSVKDRLPYTILYENDKSATAPAKYVKVIYPVDAKQDPNTFFLGNFGFNNQTFTVPPNTASYYQRLDCRDSLGLFVDVTAGLDVSANEVFWELQSIDPVTLLPPSDPLKGLLLLQDSAKQNNGHGFVNFSIKPKASDLTLDTMHAVAKIVFDSHDTIPTNYTMNTVDAFAPASHMNALPPTSNNPVALSWGGADDPGGCGVKYYTLYVSTDGVNYNIVRSNITRTDTSIVFAPNMNYSFFVLATDSVGNTEVLRPGEVRSTFVGAVVPVTMLYFRGTNMDKDNFLEWSTATEQNTSVFKLERSLVNSNSFSVITSVPAAGNSSTPKTYSYKDRNIDLLKTSVFYYRLKQFNTNGTFTYSNIVRLNYNTKNEIVQSLIYPNPTHDVITLVIGDQSLRGTTAYLYDVNGRALEAFKINADSQSINLGKYPNGTYLLRLNNKEVIRIVKM